MHSRSYTRCPKQARLCSIERRRAFTLIESMVALTILAVGLLGMVGLQLQALRQSQWGRHTTEAARLARDQLETFNRTPWSAAEMQPTAWTAPVAVVKTVQSTSGTQQEQSFNVQWRITTDGANANLRHIDVRIQWREENQQAAAPSRRYAVSSTRYNN